MEYDPDLSVDAKEWKALTEAEQFEAVEEYHRRRRIRLPRARLHAAIHVIVETQIALGGEIPAVATLERLMAEGLDRHEAIHAIGSVLAAQIMEVLQKKSPGKRVASAYFEKLERLTAEQWRKVRPEE
jgi:hypothetical protein